MNIKSKELSKLGYTSVIARSIALGIIKKNCKHESKEQIKQTLIDIASQPNKYKDNEIWTKLAQQLSPSIELQGFSTYNLLEQPWPYKVYGDRFIENLAKQQMNLAMRLPITLAGALMPDAHYGYGLPIGGVLAVKNAVIPFAVGVDIGCRMSLSVFDAGSDFLKKYPRQISKALEEFTHFGNDGCLQFAQEHPILDRNEFTQTSLLKSLHAKAVRQLGSSGGGNHFVEFGELSLEHNNVLQLPEGQYIALLSHSGSRGLGATIANHYCNLAKQICRLPRDAQHLAWLDLDTEAGQEYWMSMNLAGDFAQACHDRIHINLSKALGLKTLANIGNHHNFAWHEQIAPDTYAIVHRKGATPAGKGQAGFIPGSMATPGYLVCGKGAVDSLNSASHGAGRAMSRRKAKESFTQSSLKKLLAKQGVTLKGGSVEEMPLAYKDIDQIMSAQQSLIDIHGKFTPRIVRMNKE